MQRLREALRGLVIEVCGLLRGIAVPQREWTRIVPGDHGSATFVPELRPDFDRRFNRDIQQLASFSPVLMAVREDPLLIDRLLTPSSDQPTSDVTIQASLLFDALVEPFLRAYVSASKTFEFQEDKFDFLASRLVAELRSSTETVVMLSPLRSLALAVCRREEVEPSGGFVAGPCPVQFGDSCRCIPCPAAFLPPARRGAGALIPASAGATASGSRPGRPGPTPPPPPPARAARTAGSPALP